MDFQQWEESLTDEQKQAFDLHVRQNKNKSSDKKQYERYKARLGVENMPKTFDKFQDLKYNDIEKWNEPKGFYRYKRDNLNSGLRDHKCAKEYITNAILSITKRQGLSENYYSKQGVSYINPHELEIKTAFSSSEFKGDVKKIMEVIEKYGY